MQHGSFVVHLRDKATGNTTSTIIDVDLDGTPAGLTLDELAKNIDLIGGISASVTGGRLSINAAASSQEIVFGEDTSNALAGLGLASYFTGGGAADLGISQTLKDDPARLAASTDNRPGGNGGRARHRLPRRQVGRQPRRRERGHGLRRDALRDQRGRPLRPAPRPRPVARSKKPCAANATRSAA